MAINWSAAYRNAEKRIADNERACREEREHFVARAIKSRKRRNLPLDTGALAQEAIWLCERGTSYSEFIRDDDPVRWRNGIFEPYRTEVERQLALNAQAL
jgi:hypothetical protein